MARTGTAQAEALWDDYRATSKPTGYLPGGVEEFCIDAMDSAAYEIHQHSLKLLNDLMRLRADVCRHSPDTAWVGPGETVVDRISMIIGDGDWYNEVFLPQEKEKQDADS